MFKKETRKIFNAKAKNENIILSEREELFFAPEKVSAQDKGGEKHVFFKKKERLVHQKNTIFQYFSIFW